MLKYIMEKFKTVLLIIITISMLFLFYKVNKLEQQINEQQTVIEGKNDYDHLEKCLEIIKELKELENAQ